MTKPGPARERLIERADELAATATNLGKSIETGTVPRAASERLAALLDALADDIRHAAGHPEQPG